MSDWNRVWGTGGASCSSGGCSTDCWNIRSPNDGVTKPSAFDGLPTYVHSLAEVVGIYANQVKERIAARKALITGTSDSVFSVQYKRSMRTDTVGLSFTNSQGQLPVTVSVTTPNDSYSVYFYDMNQFVDWAVEILA